MMDSNGIGINDGAALNAAGTYQAYRNAQSQMQMFRQKDRGTFLQKNKRKYRAIINKLESQMDAILQAAKEATK